LASSASSLVRTGLGVGFLGAFTTFSTFAVEADRLDRGAATLYVVLSVALGIGAAWVGAEVGRR
ncbi:MAG TPA: CrcB family protein, partial [Acidimicrobiales bacterium]|nr:CrcB family protein [Acidimicrobiales bacterium]